MPTPEPVAETETPRAEGPRRLDAREYRRAQDAIMKVQERVLGLPVVELLAQIGHAHAVAPIVDPTLYMRGMNKLQIVEDVARALADFQKVAIEAAGRLLVAENGVPEGMTRREAEEAAADLSRQMAEGRWALEEVERG